MMSTFIDEKLLGSSYFSSLLSKEAAEKLAQLQQAGKVNSKLTTMSEKDPMEITAEEFESEETSKEENQKGSVMYLLTGYKFMILSSTVAVIFGKVFYSLLLIK
nr:unnamed protein product [Callosobruchus analis]